jgi:multiple sugar transport system ATP-binding protein
LHADALRSRVGQEVIIGIRPERITDARSVHGETAATAQRFTVPVDVVEPTGPDTLVFAQVNGKRLISRVHPATNARAGADMELVFDVSKAVAFDISNGQRIG